MLVHAISMVFAFRRCKYIVSSRRLPNIVFQPDFYGNFMRCYSSLSTQNLSDFCLDLRKQTVYKSSKLCNNIS